jgi:hypothetical protein
MLAAPRVRTPLAPPKSPACRESPVKSIKSARLRASRAVEVDQRKGRRGQIERIGQILSIAGIGGGLRRFPAARKSVEVERSRKREYENREGQKFGEGIDQARSMNPRNFSCADQLSGRSPRPVDRIWAVSSGGCRPSTILSTIVGARKARRIIRLT